MNGLHAFCVCGVLGSYAFVMRLFIAYRLLAARKQGKDERQCAAAECQ